MSGSTLVLLSGGLDSCATISLYQRQRLVVSALFVDYGQAGAPKELTAAGNVAAHFQSPLTTVRCAGIGSFADGYVRARNAFLLQVALMVAPFDVGQIAMGLHAGSPYADRAPAFVAQMQDVFDLYCGGRVRVVAPFIDCDKRGVVAFCRDARAPVELTYSCERGTEGVSQMMCTASGEGKAAVEPISANSVNWAAARPAARAAGSVSA